MTPSAPEPSAQNAPLEGPGRWRETKGAPERAVEVRLGTDTLVIRDPGGSPLSHWVLAGITESGPAAAPVFAASAETGETLTFDDAQLVAALRSAARPVRLSPSVPPAAAARGRSFAAPLALLALLGAGIAFGPDLIRAQAARMMPPEKAEETGDRMLLDLMEARGGGLCSGQDGLRTLERIAEPLVGADARPVRTRVLELGEVPVAMLPGRTVVLDRAMIAEAADPAEIAGWIALALERDAVGDLMRVAGPVQDLRYIFTGDIGAPALARATDAAIVPPAPEEATAAAGRIAGLGIDPGSFVTALRHRGLDILPPSVDAPAPLAIPAADWDALADICD